MAPMQRIHEGAFDAQRRAVVTAAFASGPR
jgi:hypothetical protein